MTRAMQGILALTTSAFVACASTSFVSSWKAPDAQPLEIEGAKVAAVVMMRSEASRRAAEDALARELIERGAQGIPMYTILPNAHAEEEGAARMALQRAGVEGLVVMRPVAVTQEIVSTPSPFSGPAYRGYWGGYHGYGWGASWVMDAGDIQTHTIVSIETLVYSLEQNKLVWGGQSRTTNPSNVDDLIAELSDEVADELEKQGLLPQ